MDGRTAAERDRHKHKMINLVQSGLLIGGMAALVAVCGWVMFGPAGVPWVVVGVVAALSLRPAIPPDMIMRFYRAERLSHTAFPDGVEIVAALAARAELPAAPRLYYVPSTTLNAFAVGSPNDAAIAVTDGLLRTLTPRELIGVIAHEISHIRSNDLWIMNLADTISRVTALLSTLGQILLLLNLPLVVVGYATVPWLLVIVLIFAPSVVALLQLALSRTREYDADLDAVELTGDPVGLASALGKLENRVGRFWEEILYPGRRIPEPSVLRTHPSTEERIRRLMALRPPPAPPRAPRPVPIRVGFDNRARMIVPGFGTVVRAPRRHWTGLWY